MSGGQDFGRGFHGRPGDSSVRPGVFRDDDEAYYEEGSGLVAKPHAKVRNSSKFSLDFCLTLLVVICAGIGSVCAHCRG